MSPGGERLFFAVWPDAAAAEALAAIAARLAPAVGGKPVPREKLHLTLAFLGTVADERRAPLDDAAASIESPAFDLTLDRLGSFRRARVAWAGSSQPPAALLALEASLAAALRARGFELEDRPFNAHVTLARSIDRPVPPARIEPVGWSARAFSLVRSETGTGRYSTLASWPLTGR